MKAPSGASTIPAAGTAITHSETARSAEATALSQAINSLMLLLKLLQKLIHACWPVRSPQDASHYPQTLSWFPVLFKL